MFRKKIRHLGKVIPKVLEVGRAATGYYHLYFICINHGFAFARSKNLSLYKSVLIVHTCNVTQAWQSPLQVCLMESAQAARTGSPHRQPTLVQTPPG